MKKNISHLKIFMWLIILTGFGTTSLRAQMTATFSNSTVINIPASGTAPGIASPYPSTITVSGMTGAINNLEVRLNLINHSWGPDLDMLLVSPTGQKFIILSDAGSSVSFDVAATITLTDAAAAFMPTTGAIPNNTTWKPTNQSSIETATNFVAPAPVGPYSSPGPVSGGTASFASIFNGFSPNGAWSLYIVDDASGDTGPIQGWDLIVSTGPPPPPANNECAGAILLTAATTCSATAGTSTLATQSQAPSTCSGFTSTVANDVWYSFVADGIHSGTINVTATFDATLELFSGACGSLTTITCIDAASGIENINTGVLPAGTYFYRIYGWNGATGTFTTCVTVNPPSNDLICNALPITCGVPISGNTTFATQTPDETALPTCVTSSGTGGGVWYTLTGVAINSSITLDLCGAAYDSKIRVWTSSNNTCTGTLTCVIGEDDDFTVCGVNDPSVTFTSAPTPTTYFVYVHGFGTGVGAFTLNSSCNQPPNDVCSGAIEVPCGGSVTGSTVGFNPDPTSCNSHTSPGVWHKVTPTNSGTLTLSLCAGTSYDSYLSVYSGTCGSLTCLASSDDFCGAQSQVAFSATAGVTYFILVNGWGTNAGTYTLTAFCPAPPAPNDNCAQAIPVPCGGSISGTTADATPDITPCSNYASNGRWHSVTPGFSGALTLSLAGSSYDTYLSVYSGACGSLTCLGQDDDSGPGTTSQLTITATANTTYYILVNGFSTSNGLYTLTATCPVSPD